MIDVDAIVDIIRQDAALFKSAWSEESTRYGSGAIVILPSRTSADSGEVECEYWTVDEIRSSLRAIQEEDEFVYRWISRCEQDGGLPVVVLSSDDMNPKSYNLTFHRFTAPAD